MNTMTPISWTVIDIIVEKMASLIGNGAVSVLNELREVDREKDPSPDLLYRVGNELGDLMGIKGGYSIIRQVGREIGHQFTKGKGPEEMKEVLESTLRELGFAYEIKLDSDEASICKCVFYKMIRRDNAKPIEKPVCWTGWGFIEGCLGNMMDMHHIEWRGRNDETEECRFSIEKTPFSVKSHVQLQERV